MVKLKEKFLIVLSVLLLILPHNLKSQDILKNYAQESYSFTGGLNSNSTFSSKLFDKGNSGTSLSGRIFSGDKFYGYEISFGFSINGVFDIGLGISRYSFDNPDSLDNFDLKGISLFPSISYHLLKQSENTPVSIAIGISYKIDFYSSQFLKDQHPHRPPDMSASGISYGSIVYSTAKMSDSFQIMPELGIIYDSNNLIIDTGFISGENEYSDDLLSLKVGLNFRFASSNSAFYFNPGIIANKYDNNYTITMSFIIASANN